MKYPNLEIISLFIRRKHRLSASKLLKKVDVIHKKILMLQRSSSIFVRRGNGNTSVIARYFGTADNDNAYSSQKGNIFGDERDLIAKRLIRDGGSPSLVIENLKTIRKKFTHDPIPYSKDVPKHKEHLFVSMPNENPAKKVRQKDI